MELLWAFLNGYFCFFITRDPEFSPTIIHDIFRSLFSGIFFDVVPLNTGTGADYGNEYGKEKVFNSACFRK